LADGSFTLDAYYNNAKVGSTVSMTGTPATAIKSNKLHGAFSTYDGNLFDNFMVRPRGTEGQYSCLDLI